MAWALRTVGTLILLFVGFQYYVFDVLAVPPIGVALLLYALSYAAKRWRRIVAAISLVVSVVTPLAAIYGYWSGFLVGDIAWGVPIFDGVIFAWLFWKSLQALRTAQGAIADA